MTGAASESRILTLVFEDIGGAPQGKVGLQ